MKIINENKKVPGNFLLLQDAKPGFYVTTHISDCFYEVILDEDGNGFFRCYHPTNDYVPGKLKNLVDRTAEVHPVNRVGLDTFEYTEDRIPNREDDYIELYNNSILTIKKDGKAVVFSLAVCYETDLKAAGMVLGIEQLIYNGELL